MCEWQEREMPKSLAWDFWKLREIRNYFEFSQTQFWYDQVRAHMKSPREIDSGPVI